jgi:hypothetical protein
LQRVSRLSGLVKRAQVATSHSMGFVPYKGRQLRGVFWGGRGGVVLSSAVVGMHLSRGSAAGCGRGATPDKQLSGTA